MSDLFAGDLIVRGLLQPSLGSPGYRSFRASDDGSQIVQSRKEELALRGKVFSASRAAVTIPVNANNLVSVFSLYNPPNSNSFLKLISVSAHAVLAATVVDALGVYFQQGSLVQSATFTTRDLADVQAARLGEGVAPQGQLFSALTHSGTPALADIVGGWGAVTDGGSTEAFREWDGEILLPPNGILSVAMSTAASTASGITLVARWAEIPYVAQ